MDHRRQPDSLTVMTELVLPNDANILGNLLGGRLLHWIDIAGAMAASRFTQGLVATVAMDPVNFRHPVKVGSIVTLTARVTWTGRTSLETMVEVTAEAAPYGACQSITSTHVVFVAMDESAQKRSFLPFASQTEAEKREFEEGARRQEERTKAGTDGDKRPGCGT